MQLDAFRRTLRVCRFHRQVQQNFKAAPLGPCSHFAGMWQVRQYSHGQWKGQSQHALRGGNVIAQVVDDYGKLRFARTCAALAGGCSRIAGEHNLDGVRGLAFETAEKAHQSRVRGVLKQFKAVGARDALPTGFNSGKTAGIVQGDLQPFRRRAGSLSRSRSRVFRSRTKNANLRGAAGRLARGLDQLTSNGIEFEVRPGFGPTCG